MFTYHCSSCHQEVESYCPVHPSASVESIYCPSLSKHTLSTLGVWAHGPAKISASYHDETSIRIDVEGRSRVLTEREWLAMWDDLRDAGYVRQ